MNKKRLAFLLCIIFAVSPGLSGQDFSSYFSPGVLRLDLIFAGNNQSEKVYLSSLLREATWAGPEKHLTSSLPYGEYRFSLFDEESGREIYNQGFSSLFREWRSTPEAQQLEKAYNQVIRMPFPKRPVRFELSGRSGAVLVPLLTLRIDPSDPFIQPARVIPHRTEEILIQGTPRDKLDLVFVAEGYVASQYADFMADVRRLANRLIKTQPFMGRVNDFNIRAVFAPSADQGTDNPMTGIWANTVLSSSLFTFGTERYLMVSDYVQLCNYIADVPWDIVYVLVASEHTAGGGIYNFYGLNTRGGAFSESVFLHEMGHVLGGLADEYYTSDVPFGAYYRLDVEPWEPNITTLVHFDQKWQSLLRPKTPVPTPPKRALPLGVYEGAAYASKGIYRPALKCCMSDNVSPFCGVCTQALNQMMDYYTR